MLTQGSPVTVLQSSELSGAWKPNGDGYSRSRNAAHSAVDCASQSGAGAYMAIWIMLKTWWAATWGSRTKALFTSIQPDVCAAPVAGTEPAARLENNSWLWNFSN